MKRFIALAFLFTLIMLPQNGFAVPYDQYTATGDETFWSISRQLEVNVSDLIKINPLVNQRNIWRGLMINIPNGHKPMSGLMPASEVSRTTYTIKYGDTLWDIAQRNGISLSYLLQANPTVNNPHNIFSGLLINVPNAPFAISPFANWQAKADFIIAAAKDQFDSPYVWGGTKPWIGMDCSGLTQYVFSRAGINLPRTANLQYQSGTPVPKNQLRKGDLVFFKEHNMPNITHVGLYMGNDIMINADTGPKNGVQLEYIFGDDYYNKAYAGARRYFE